MAQQHSLSADQLLATMVEASDFTLDQRHNLALVARPPQHVVALLTSVQQQLHALAGDALWLPPPSHLHVTVYEITHSKTPQQLQPLVSAIRSHGLRLFEALPVERVKFDAPLVNFDTAAVAVTFLPVNVDGYSIAAFRSELAGRLSELGVEWDGRYVAPTAHVTIARFVKPELQNATMEQWLLKLDELREQCQQWEGGWCLADARLQVMTDKSWYGGGTVVTEAIHD